MNNQEKEKNFVSAVVYLGPEGGDVQGFFTELSDRLEEHFAQYELVVVNDCAPASALERLREFAAQMTKPLTILHMSLRQGVEQCMNAGLDISIGDYVYEFDDIRMNWDSSLIWEAYRKAMEGNDIVNVCPSRSGGRSRLFYRLFNRYSGSAYRLRTEAFRLVSRRAVNKVHAVSAYLPYRKAAYAASGLKMGTLEYQGQAVHFQDLDLGVNSLLLYTTAGYRISFGITLAMLVLALAELVYTLAVTVAGHPIEGWTTTMFVITCGFSGLFAIMTLVVKYLSLILDTVFKKQQYFVESIEKIQK